MAILEKEVWVVVNGANLKYLESLDYEILRIKTKGKISVVRGTKILVKVEHLTKGSHSQLTKICDDCGEYVPNIKFSDIIRKRMNGDGKDRCFKCGSKKKGKTQQNVEYNRTLEYCAIRGGKEYLLYEFSTKNERKANEVAYQSNLSYIWNCLECGSEYQMKVNNRTSNKNNNGCPYCSGQKVNHTNCLATKHPNILNYMTDKEIAFKVTSGTAEYADFICPDCGSVDNKSIKNVVSYGFTCQICSDGLSYPEKFMVSLLNQLDIEFKTQKTFTWSKAKRYDFYIPKLNCIIETHGNQHYQESFEHLGGRLLKEEQANDKLKEKLAKDNKIDDYVVIDCSKSEMDYISNNIYNSKLNDLLDLSKIEWLKCHEYACNSLVKVVCNMRNDNPMSTVELGKILGLDRSTINRYLKLGNIIGWCNYNPKDVQKINVQKAITSTRKQVVQLTKDNNFIKQWDSIAEAARYLNIQHTGVIMACKGKISQSGGYKWMYMSDYENKVTTC